MGSSNFFSYAWTPATSVYSPTDVDNPLTPEWKALDELNAFLESRDISPARHPMKTQWEEASDRTKRRHTRKAKQAVDAVLDENQIRAINFGSQWLYLDLLDNTLSVMTRSAQMKCWYRRWRNAKGMLIIGKAGGKYFLEWRTSSPSKLFKSGFQTWQGIGSVKQERIS